MCCLARFPSAVTSQFALLTGLELESDQGVVTVRTRDDLQQRGDHFDILRAVVAQQQCLGMKAHFRCWSDVPIGSGLSSSSSLVVAALYALMRYQGRTMNEYLFAETARGIELNEMGVICGYHDFYMPAFGGLNYMDFPRQRILPGSAQRTLRFRGVTRVTRTRVALRVGAYRN